MNSASMLVKLAEGKLSPEQVIRYGVMAASVPTAVAGYYFHRQAVENFVRNAKKHRNKAETEEAARKRVGRLVKATGLPIAYQVGDNFFDDHFVPTKTLWNLLGKDKTLREYIPKGVKKKDIKGGILVGLGTPDAVVQHELGHAESALGSTKGKIRSKAKIGLGLGSVALPLAYLMTKDRALANKLVVGGLALQTINEAAGLLEERRASKTALQKMKERGYDKKDIRRAKKLLDRAYGTYTSHLAASLPTELGLAAFLWRKAG